MSLEIFILLRIEALEHCSAEESFTYPWIIQCWQTVVLPVLSATRLWETCQDMTEAAITIRCGQNT